MHYSHVSPPLSFLIFNCKIVHLCVQHMLWRFSFTLLICIYLIDLFINIKLIKRWQSWARKWPVWLCYIIFHGHSLIDNYLRFIVLTQKEVNQLCYWYYFSSKMSHFWRRQLKLLTSWPHWCWLAAQPTRLLRLSCNANL